MSEAEVKVTLSDAVGKLLEGALTRVRAPNIERAYHLHWHIQHQRFVASNQKYATALTVFESGPFLRDWNFKTAEEREAAGRTTSSDATLALERANKRLEAFNVRAKEFQSK